MEEFFTDINSIPRWILLITGFIPLILKLRSHFSKSRERQIIKQDLEILELAKKTGLESKVLEDSLRDKLLIDDSGESKIFGFLTGFFVFIFFGFWSISVYEDYNGFSAWMGFPIFMSLVGISMLFDESTRKNKEEVFLKIELSDRRNFQFAFVIFLFTFIVGGLIYLRDDEINFWVILNFFFLMISIRSILKCLTINSK
ncbi:hypothetical protein PBT90_00025 [Algoriphagus halophytocola]|uniref:hypothetical protein n=1 Tax=Algoriphagus halophytocola TaxID=2991499 RepID=UPI0022DE08E3|nr:hypothetical protein [Algoriphagus sp. TR-M9]WBL42369.1 hypothetical protein PBT90_16660 [Algoriphagus sp. TR-M9]WBL43094.1 hypothetical protein PBT90_00025 [Algoriphagus sp. TR-M9]